MTIATVTLEQSVLPVVTAFGAQVVTAAADATALNHVISGLDDGNDYGRYSAAENPLQSFAAATISVAAMIAQGAALRAALAQAVATATADAVGNVGNLWLDLLTVTGALRRACADPRDAIRILEGLAGFSFTAPPSVAGDPIGAQIAALTGATARLARRAAAVSLALASADYVPNSYQEAQAILNDILAVFAAVIQEAGDSFDDNAYAALDALQAAIVADLTARGGSLAPVVRRNFGAQQPALVLAYRLYQDSARADDILARNDPPHPAFLPASVEVLAA